MLRGLVERVRGADVDVTERVRQRRELLPPVLREEAGYGEVELEAKEKARCGNTGPNTKTISMETL